MISDDLKNDDIVDDDFDIDDFDDGDWDSEDESLDGSETGAETSSNQQDKTFLQKFFIPIVVVIFGIFGVIFLASQGFLNSSSSDVDVTAEAVVVAPEISTPQEDVTIAVAPDNAQDVQAIMKAPLEDINVLQETPEPTLRPLPDDNANQQLELVDLEAELQSTSEALPILEEAPIGDLDISALEIEESPITSIDDSMAETADLVGSELEIAEIPAAEPVQPVEDMPLTMDEPMMEKPAIIDEPADPMMMLSDDIVETAPDSKEDIVALEKAIDDLKSENENLNQNLIDNEAVIGGLNSEIESLNAMIKDLKLAAANQNEKEPVMPVKQEAMKKVDQMAENTPEMAPKKPVSKTKPSPKKAVKWVLKSAQPGKATISIKGSNDLKSVEIGSVIAGIGRITDISNINGSWVVKGTKGSISR